MTNKIRFYYIIIYLTLNSISFSFASMVWWTDGLTLSYLNKETLTLLACMGISWIAALYLSIHLAIGFILKVDFQKFIGPLDLVINEYYQKENGIDFARKIKQYLQFLAFPIFAFAILLFIFLMNCYENYQINEYGKEEIVIIKEIKKGMKRNKYIHFNYNKGQSSNLPANNLQPGDYVEIIYSAKNPKIVRYKNE